MVPGTVVPMRKGPLKSVKLTVIGGNLVIVLFVCCHSSETAWIMVALILITTALRCHQTMHRVGHRKELSDKLSTENNVCTHESFESTQPTPAWPSKHKLLPLDQHIHLPHRALSTQLPSYIPDPLQWLQHPLPIPLKRALSSSISSRCSRHSRSWPRVRLFFSYARGQRDTSWRAPS